MRSRDSGAIRQKEMSVVASIRELYQCRDLLLLWAIRGVKARYQQTFLGIIWAILQPLALTGIYTVVFSMILKMDSASTPYSLYIFVGLLPWSLFASTVSSGIPSIVQNMDLITKIYFPREILPIASMAVPLVDFISGVSVLILLMIVFAIPLNVYMLFLPILVLIQVLFSAGLILAGSAANVMLRDVGHLVPLALVVWQFATPIIYSLESVPANMRPFYLLNPMAALITSYKQILLESTLPDWRYVAIALGVSIVTLVVGYCLFRQVEHTFADVI